MDKQTNSSKPTTVSEHFLCDNHDATDMQLIPLELVKFNRDSVRKAREVYLIERGQTLEPHGLNKKDETLYQRSMLRSFVHFIAALTTFQAVTLSHIFKFLNFEFLRYFFHGTYYLALSISRLLLFIFSFVISHFSYFKLVTLKTLVILCNTLKKEGRAFRNIGKN